MLTFPNLLNIGGFGGQDKLFLNQVDVIQVVFLKPPRTRTSWVFLLVAEGTANWIVGTDFLGLLG
jgi:hypothetical protein